MQGAGRKAQGAGCPDRTTPCAVRLARCALRPVRAAAHLRSLTVGHEVIIPITEGKLDFGPWQRVFYGEWDGKRRKRVVIKVIGA